MPTTHRPLELIPKPDQLTLMINDGQLLLLDSDALPTLIASTVTHRGDTQDDYLTWALHICDRIGYLVTTYRADSPTQWHLAGPDNYTPITVTHNKDKIIITKDGTPGDSLSSWIIRANWLTELAIIGWAADVLRDDGYTIIGYQRTSQNVWTMAARTTPAIPESMYVAMDLDLSLDITSHRILDLLKFSVECSTCGRWGRDLGLPGAWTRRGTNLAASHAGWRVNTIRRAWYQRDVTTMTCPDCLADGA